MRHRPTQIFACRNAWLGFPTKSPPIGDKPNSSQSRRNSDCPSDGFRFKVLGLRDRVIANNDGKFGVGCPLERASCIACQPFNDRDVKGLTHLQPLPSIASISRSLADRQTPWDNRGKWQLQHCQAVLRERYHPKTQPKCSGVGRPVLELKSGPTLPLYAISALPIAV